MSGSQIAPKEVMAFLISEARLLDERRWEEWLALFAKDGWYWVPIEEKQSNPKTTISLMYDDRKLLETRIRRLAAGSLHSQAPVSRTTRTVDNATIESESNEIITVRSKFLMIEYRRDKQRMFGGTSWHDLRRNSKAFIIASKKVELVNCDSMMDGLNVPF